MGSVHKHERTVFTKEMQKTHTILVPTMLPIHLNFIVTILNQHGFHAELLENTGRKVVDEGLKNVHNDTCYPALLVIGQMLDALGSGKYDPKKVALMITQTGGGCRASNYIHLLRKALKKSGYGYVPVISFSIGNLESNPGFSLSVPILQQLTYAVLLGDLLMLLANQCRPYEVTPGETDALIQKWVLRFTHQFQEDKVVRYKKMVATYPEILDSFDRIPKTGEKKIKVGIVGEIYVKYSPLGNNNLEAFLLSEGAEPVVPGLLDFCLYCVYNGIEDHKLYGGGAVKSFISKIAMNFLLKKQNVIIKAIKKHGVFFPPTSFDETVKMVEGYIDRGVKMGEGWLLTAEMLELIHLGVENIVCTQPFGCLPNHIVGKGMIRSIKKENPSANIVAVDYDPGASEINQQNRIKLMLANATIAK